jgi:bis(5'-nucleosyl)-tetraphosphatase (symmetrical)
VLRDDYWREGIAELYDKKGKTWTPELGGKKRLRAILSALVSMRGITAEGEHSPSTDAPDELPAGFRPWFDIPGRRSADHCIIFGHWSTLGLRNQPNLIALDTGCVWGGQLTAVRLDDRTVFQVEAVEREPVSGSG